MCLVFFCLRGLCDARRSLNVSVHSYHRAQGMAAAGESARSDTLTESSGGSQVSLALSAIAAEQAPLFEVQEDVRGARIIFAMSPSLTTLIGSCSKASMGPKLQKSSPLTPSLQLCSSRALCALRLANFAKTHL